jgi:membrane protease YdiL (CAAX protease family)
MIYLFPHMRHKNYLYWLTAANTYSFLSWRYYRLPIVILLLDFFLTFVVLGIFSLIEVPLSEPEPFEIVIFSWSFFAFILYVSASEELLFRILPLLLTMKLTRRREVLVIVMVISAAFFGYVHGGVSHIFLQGIGGFLYSVLFIKYSRRGKNPIEGSLVVITIHSLFNIAISSLLLLGGEVEI